MHTNSIFKLKTQNTFNNWKIIDDAVMGGKSVGKFKVNSTGNLIFFGKISLDNNGGFSSIKNYLPEPIVVKNNNVITIKLKGDGKRYQFRIKETSNQKHSYTSYFQTSGHWEIITIYLNNLIPKLKGKLLDISSFKGDSIAEIGFLFGNRQEESFKLIIDDVALQYKP